MPIFKIVGLLLALYTFYAAVKGEVYGRSGVRARLVSKRQSPRYFWVVIFAYAVLSVVLMVS